MIINPGDDERCVCGSFGCLEQQVRIERIRRIIQESSARFPDSLLLDEPPEQINNSRLFDAARKGDPMAREIDAYLAGQFALALRNIILSFDPDLIVFQGDFAHADSYFRHQLISRLKVFQLFSTVVHFDIRYDTRPLKHLDFLGASRKLLTEFFSNPEIYEDTEDIP